MLWRRAPYLAEPRVISRRHPEVPELKIWLPEESYGSTPLQFSAETKQTERSRWTPSSLKQHMHNLCIWKILLLFNQIRLKVTRVTLKNISRGSNWPSIYPSTEKIIALSKASRIQIRLLKQIQVAKTIGNSNINLPKLQEYHIFTKKYILA